VILPVFGGHPAVREVPNTKPLPSASSVSVLLERNSVPFAAGAMRVLSA